jgi:hypothetical protein
MTKAKQSAIDTQEELKEWQSEIMELLSRGGSHLFNEYVISFPDFFDGNLLISSQFIIFATV